MNDYKLMQRHIDERNKLDYERSRERIDSTYRKIDSTIDKLNKIEWENMPKWVIYCGLGIIIISIFL